MRTTPKSKSRPHTGGSGGTPATTYTLTASSGSGGKITASGIDTSVANNSQDYPAGTVVPVTATPNSGYTFNGWGGDLSGVQTSKSITMNANHTISATFSAVTQSSGRWYSDSSPFNQKNALGGAVRAGTGSDLAYNGDPASSAQIISRIIAQGTMTKKQFGTARTSGDFSHPFYFATGSDPMLTLRPGYGNSWLNLDGAQLRVPLNALPAGGSDGSMTVVQPDGWEFNLWKAQIPNVPSGEMRCGFAKKVRHDGTGLEEPNSIGGITAAGFANGLGIIRIDELKAGLIDHALFCSVNGWHKRCWPGQSSGGTTGQTTLTTAPPMGMLFRLNMSASAINALNRPAWQKTINLAQAEYGMYIGDNSGAVLNIQVESDVPFRARNETEEGVAWAQSVGLPSFQQSVFDVDLQQNVTRTLYTMDWSLGIDWASKLQALKPPAS